MVLRRQAASSGAHNRVAAPARPPPLPPLPLYHTRQRLPSMLVNEHAARTCSCRSHLGRLSFCANSGSMTMYLAPHAAPKPHPSPRPTPHPPPMPRPATPVGPPARRTGPQGTAAHSYGGTAPRHTITRTGTIRCSSCCPLSRCCVAGGWIPCCGCAPVMNGDERAPPKPQPIPNPQPAQARQGTRDTWDTSHETMARAGCTDCSADARAPRRRRACCS